MRLLLLILVLVSCGESFSERRFKAELRFCGKLEMCTGASLSQCLNNLSHINLNHDYKETELLKFINYTDFATCSQLNSLVMQQYK